MNVTYVPPKLAIMVKHDQECRMERKRFFLEILKLCLFQLKLKVPVYFRILGDAESRFLGGCRILHSGMI